MNSQPILIIAGTRAEALKLILLYKKLKAEHYPVFLCTTYQHTTLIDDVFSLFNVVPDYSLHVMKENQDLFHLTSAILNKTNELYQQLRPSLVIVHGDTTTTMASALSAFYNKIPIAHIEAGLRTGNVMHPFPEELNRKIVGQCATYHFTPTARATAHLFSEKSNPAHIFCVGNTIVDTMFYIQDKIKRAEIEINSMLKNIVESTRVQKKKLFLLTAHRRESFDGGLVRVFESVKRFVGQHSSSVHIIFPYHPNPNVVRAISQTALHEQRSITLLQALPYHELLYVLERCDGVITDSGGIQEEALTLGKPIICVRDVTERNEGVWEGAVELVGTDEKKIEQALGRLHSNQHTLLPSLAYGDGQACERILAIFKTVIFPNNSFVTSSFRHSEMRHSI